MSYMYDITPSDLAKGRNLQIGAFAAPVLLTLIPAIITFLLLLLAATGPPVAAVILFVGVIATVIGFITSVVIAVVLAQRRSVLTSDVRERITADGIRAEEIQWVWTESKLD